MRQRISWALVLVFATHFVPPAFSQNTLERQIKAMPPGASIEVRLKSGQTIRGPRGEVSESGFALVEPGAGDRQISFDEIASVKQLQKNSHATRNILIVAGVGLVIAGRHSSGASQDRYRTQGQCDSFAPDPATSERVMF